MEIKTWILVFNYVLNVKIVLSSSDEVDENLSSVIVLYRHGARTPVKLYKNDPYATEAQNIWPEGLGQLTNDGIDQQRHLGIWLRKRYQHFIRPQYHVEDIKVISSDVDRCLMSATSNLEGLYAPVQGPECRVQETWRPVPIHTIPTHLDELLALGKPCAKYEKLYEEQLGSDHFVKLFKEYEDLSNYLEDSSGEKINDFFSLMLLNDALKVERLYNLTLPAWTDSVYPQKMGELLKIYWDLPTHTTELARLRIGPLIDMMTSHFESIYNQVPEHRKFLMLSAHDTTVTYLMNALNISDIHQPDYAATLMLELRNNNINIIFKNGTYSEEAHEKTLKSCDFDCPLEKFKQIIAPLRIDKVNWIEECSRAYD